MPVSPSSSPPFPEARLIAFERWLSRVLDHAKKVREKEIPEIVRDAGLPPNTVYRWLRRENVPNPTHIEQLCNGLSVPTDTPLLILWPGKSRRPAAPDPITSDPDIAVILGKLNHPKVSDAEKYYIRETLRALATHTPAPQPRKASRRRAS